MLLNLLYICCISVLFVLSNIPSHYHARSKATLKLGHTLYKEYVGDPIYSGLTIKNKASVSITGLRKTQRNNANRDTFNDKYLLQIHNKHFFPLLKIYWIKSTLFKPSAFFYLQTNKNWVGFFFTDVVCTSSVHQFTDVQ